MRRTPTVCPTCGGTTAPGRFCRRCGADLAAPETWRDQTADNLPLGSVGSDAPARPRGARRRAWGIVLIVGGLLLALGGIGVVGYAVGRSRDDRAAPAPATPTTPTTPSPTTPARTGMVEVAPALAARPETGPVAAVLSAYFTAINERDWPAYRATLVDRPSVARTEADFRRRYRSTRDDDVRLLGLRPGDDGSWVASVAFTSRQDPADAPDRSSACLRWSLALPLVPSGGTLLIDAAGLSTTVRRPC